MTHDEKRFFKQLGARIAALRKDQAMTQVRLAKAMDVSQQTVASWKVGQRGLTANLPGYGVETRVLNQAVKRNAGRFPDDLLFQLTAAETAASRSQSVTLKPGRGQNIKFLPYAFTEHGAIMAATVLNSSRAVEMCIYVVRAFVQLRELTSSKPASRRSSSPTTMPSPPCSLRFENS
jgi:transcriptional regulator with XRE-family HTH domain